METDSAPSPPLSKPAALLRAAQAIVDRRRQLAAGADTPGRALDSDPPSASTAAFPSQTPGAPDTGAQPFQGAETKPGQLLGSIDTLTAPGRDGSGFEVRHADSGRLIAQGGSAEEADARAQDLARQWGRRRMVAWLADPSGNARPGFPPPQDSPGSNAASIIPRNSDGKPVNLDDLDDSDRQASVANVAALGPAASRQDIARAQSIAQQEGFDVGPAGVDGKWGEHTRAALHDWLGAPYETEGDSAQVTQAKVFTAADWAEARAADPSLPEMVPRTQWEKYEPNFSKLQQHPDSTNGQFKLITLHHTGSESTPEEVEALQRGHESTFHYLERAIKAGGKPEPYNFDDVGYNFLIASDGTIYEGRSLKYEGAHVSNKVVGNKNPGNIGVAFLGDYSNNPLSDAQMKSAYALVNRLNGFYGIASKHPDGSDYIFTHAQFDPARHSELAGAKDQIQGLKNRIHGRQP